VHRVRRYRAPPIGILAAALLLAGCHNRATPEDGDARPVAPSDPTMEAEDIDGRPVLQAEELLVGRFPGVRVIQAPGGGIMVRVWGPGTLNADAEPLYVVDGVPVHTTPGRGLYWLSPGDIATIRVLKDISETAAYGVRGGNGVVLITTRRGSRDDGG
jgi:TonB-dependent SusC/RagA subfamily outer membrane receptor